jgi:hypothetical protein
MEPGSSGNVFIWTDHISLSWTRRIHSTSPHPITLKYILILFLNLYIGLLIDLLSDFHTKFLHTFKFYTNMPHSLCVILLNVITNKNIGDDWKSWTSSLWNILRAH